MSRPLRVNYPQMMSHIITKGNNGMLIFKDNQDFKKYIYILKKIKKETNFKLYAFCLMPNHVHLFIEITSDDPSKSISRIMQRINLSYAIYFNRKYNRSGHVWNNRFKNVIIETGKQSLNVLRYIDANPYKLKAKYREKPYLYRWSSCKAHFGGDSEFSSFIDEYIFDGNLIIDAHKSDEKSLLWYQQFVISGIIKNCMLKDKYLECSYIVGSALYIIKILNRFKYYFRPVYRDFNRLKRKIFLKNFCFI